MIGTQRFGALAALALAALLSSACSSTSSGKSASGWLQPSPSLRHQIDDQIKRLPWTHGVERVEQITWLATVGEPAYEQLLALCADPRADVAASAVAALGATRDSRLVEPLRAVKWSADDDRALRFERARSFVRLGDWGQLGALIDGLAEEDGWTRAWCIVALREVTGQDLGYEPRAEAADRAQAVERWRNWYASRTSEGILAQSR